MDLTRYTNAEGQQVMVSSLQATPAELWVEKYGINSLKIGERLYALELQTCYPEKQKEMTVDLQGLVFAGPNFDYTIDGLISWDEDTEKWEVFQEVEWIDENNNSGELSGEKLEAFLKLIAI